MINIQIFIKYTSLIIIAFLSTFLVHNYVFSSHLRHGMVEDGSVSQYAGDVLDSRSISEKYSAIFESDGRSNGRYRPIYFVYETIPFILTVLKNGDFPFGQPFSKIKNRINGDVRFHMIYLLTTIALSLSIGSLLVYKLSNSFIYAGLFPLTVVFAPVLVENVTYNDTAEVPQLLGLALYMLLFFIGENATKTNIRKGIFFILLSIPILIILYLTKETSIIIFPSLFLYLLCNYIAIKKKMLYSDITNSLFYHLSHLILNFILTLWVLTQVYQLRNGDYSSHYEISSINQIWVAFQAYKAILVSFPPTIYIPLTAIIVIILCLIFSKNLKLDEIIREKILTQLIRSVFFISIGTGLLFLNLPWEFLGERYLLPVAYFFSLTGCFLVSTLHINILKNRFILQLLLVAIVIAISFPSAAKEILRTPKIYDREYGVHRIIDTITEKIISETKTENKQYHVLMDVSNMSTWMWLQSARIINKEGKLNVTVPGQKYPPERLYLHQFEHSPEVVIVPSDGDAYSNSYDIIFSAIPLNKKKRNEKFEKLRKIENLYTAKEKYPIYINNKKVFELLVYFPH